MKTSFVQIFDKKDDAIEAIGFMSKSFPEHRHQLVDSSNQVQLWARFSGKDETRIYGAPDITTAFLVTSTAPD